MQKFNLQLSQYIASDLKNITRYLPMSAYNKLIQKLNYKFLTLREMPKIYQKLYYDVKNDEEYRRFVINKYIVTYKIHKNKITILRIVSEKTDYLKSIKKSIHKNYI